MKDQLLAPQLAEAEDAIHAAAVKFHVLLTQGMEDPPDLAGGKYTAVLITFCNPSREINPDIDLIDTRVNIIAPEVEMDDKGTLTKPMDIKDITIPLEERLAFALRHVVEEVAMPILSDSPCARLSGKTEVEIEA